MKSPPERNRKHRNVAITDAGYKIILSQEVRTAADAVECGLAQGDVQGLGSLPSNVGDPDGVPGPGTGLGEHLGERRNRWGLILAACFSPSLCASRDEEVEGGSVAVAKAAWSEFTEKGS